MSMQYAQPLSWDARSVGSRSDSTPGYCTASISSRVTARSAGFACS